MALRWGEGKGRGEREGKGVEKRSGSLGNEQGTENKAWGQGVDKTRAWEDKKDRGYKQGVRDEVGGGR